MICHLVGLTNGSMPDWNWTILVRNVHGARCLRATSTERTDLSAHTPKSPEAIVAELFEHVVGIIPTRRAHLLPPARMLRFPY